MYPSLSNIKTDIVDSDIPLLLSKSAIKSADIKLDLENDTATMNNVGKTSFIRLH